MKKVVIMSLSILSIIYEQSWGSDAPSWVLDKDSRTPAMAAVQGDTPSWVMEEEAEETRSGIVTLRVKAEKLASDPFASGRLIFSTSMIMMGHSSASALDELIGPDNARTIMTMSNAAGQYNRISEWAALKLGCFRKTSDERNAILAGLLGDPEQVSPARSFLDDPGGNMPFGSPGVRREMLAKLSPSNRRIVGDALLYGLVHYESGYPPEPARHRLAPGTAYSAH